MITEKEKISCIQLSRSENVGSITFQELLKYYGTAQNAIKELPELIANGGGGKKKKIRICSYEAAKKEYYYTLEAGGGILVSTEEEYPELLKQIYDYPPVLSYIGNKELLKNEAVAIVGTRNASTNGKQLTYKISRDLSDSGYTIVSGMALGIDRKSHEGALSSPVDNAGSTIAVIGCGVDVCYPESNKDIYEEIKERGVVVSEFPLGSSPQAMNFPRRNRIISGLSLATLVIEAQKRSGSLITAKAALEQNREVMAVPGSPLDVRGSGPNYLLKQGAILIESAGDIISALQTKKDCVVKEWNIEIEAPPLMSIEEIKQTNQEDNREKILSHLNVESVSIDSIIQETGIPYSVVSVVLLELELAGRLERHPNGKVALIVE